MALLDPEDTASLIPASFTTIYNSYKQILPSITYLGANSLEVLLITQICSNKLTYNDIHILWFAGVVSRFRKDAPSPNNAGGKIPENIDFSSIMSFFYILDDWWKSFE